MTARLQRCLTTLMGRVLKASLLLSVLLFAATGHAQSGLLIFGDSLSETGNASGPLVLPPPYSQNRISNGPVAVDFFATSLGLTATASGFLFGQSNGLNYAVAGGNANGSGGEDLNNQMNGYFADFPGQINPDWLVLVIIGGNDVRAARGKDASTANATISAAAAWLQISLGRLLDQGAKHLVVANAPDIGRIPETMKLEPFSPGVSAQASALTINFNQRVTQILAALKQQYNAKIELFDLHQAFADILDNPAGFGFINSTEACFNPNNVSFHPQCDFDKFVFFDSLHPTSRTHQIVAGKILTANSKGVAIPGVILLLLE